VISRTPVKRGLGWGKEGGERRKREVVAIDTTKFGKKLTPTVRK